MELREQALKVLCLPDPAAKAAATRALFDAPPPLDGTRILAHHGTLPGRPARPRLVPPKAVAQRSPFTPEGRAALLHAVAHIEFNAIKNVFLVDIPYCEIRCRPASSPGNMSEAATKLASHAAGATMSNVKLAVVKAPGIPSNPG